MKTLAILIFCSLAVMGLTSDSADSNGDDDNNGRRENYRQYDSYARRDDVVVRRDDNGRRDDYVVRRDNGHYDNGYNNGYYDAVNNHRYGVFVDRRQAAAVVPPRAAPRELSVAQLESLREVCESDTGCGRMMGTSGVVAAYNTYYGPVPY
ncbi:osteocalcin-like isoform X1 [Entelurus aequoreus]|uniref:osteocalcin-like isoform X1 n=1 Tax=Entelurus aequoreus TaxID=161455 RepID=UPI002B1D358D|nr:osteocalcin-like isoform X1 [Entelurus aequoreus]XP_061893199.1 osteocalcin-like isoform X1 [Entelurus aequoreus]